MHYPVHKLAKHPSAFNQQGFSLIEVLIALVIIAVALLGFAKMQILNSQNFMNAYTRTQTVMFLEEMIAKLHSNQQVAKDGHFNFSMTGLKGVSSLSSSDKPAEKAFYNWIASIHHILPGAKGSVFCDDKFICAITVNYSNNLGTIKQMMMTKL